MLTIFEELVSVAICSRSNLRSTGLEGSCRATTRHMDEGPIDRGSTKETGCC